MPMTLPDADGDTDLARSLEPVIVRSGDPRPTLWNRVDLEGGALKCCECVGRPGKTETRARAHHEMFAVMARPVEFVETDGDLTRIGPAPAGSVPKGWTGLWRTVEEARTTCMFASSVVGGEAP